MKYCLVSKYQENTLKYMNLIKFKKEKYSPGVQHRLGYIHLRSTPVQVELGVLVNNKLNE